MTETTLKKILPLLVDFVYVSVKPMCFLLVACVWNNSKGIVSHFVHFDKI